jgi:hypothetical protein
MEKLFNDIEKILILHRCNIWSNSWMWEPGYHANLKYHYLLYKTINGIHYNDVQNISINIYLDDNTYRVEIRDHEYKFWEYTEKESILVAEYIKDVIKNQYNSIESSYNLRKLSNNIPNLYKIMQNKIRKNKLKTIKWKNI